MRKKEKNQHRGFTLVELLITIAVIGLLAGITLVSFPGAQEKARLAQGLGFSDSLRGSMQANMIGWWTLDGSANDSWWDQKSGTVHGNPTWVEGIVNDCIVFDGSGDYIEIEGDLGDPSAMTMSFWFYVTEADKTRVQYFADGRNGGNWWFLQSYSPTGTGNINFYNRVKVLPEDWQAGKWNHLTLTINSGGSRIYINGDLKASGSGLNPNLGIKMTIGARYTYSGAFRGRMDDFQIFDQILTLAKIKQIYFAGLDAHQILAKK